MVRLRSLIPAALALVVLAIVVDALRVEIRSLNWIEIVQDVRAMAAPRLALAGLFTVLSYLALTAYDLLAFQTIAARLSRWRIGAVSFLSYAISHSAGAAMLSGASIRLRYYSRWAISLGDFSRVVVAYSVTFWLGILVLCGASLIAAPLPDAAGWPSRAVQIPAAVLLLAVVAGYLVLTTVRREPIRIRRFELPLPGPAIGLAQVAVSTVEWILAAAALYVLIPGDVSFLRFLGAFLVAMLLGLASHIPGGLGVFDGILALLLGPSVAPATLAPALVAYRAIYYAIPFAIALVVLLIDEFRQRRTAARQFAATIVRWTHPLAPRILSVLTFVAGLVLLFSGATPAAASRLALVGHWLPIGVIEASHFNASVLGVLLLLLSQGISRRLDAAWYLACAALCGGIALSLVKGLDYEEALALTVLLGLLMRARAAFTRRAALFETRFSRVWVATVLAAVGASAWLAVFSFEHVEYSRELLWRFELHAEASRALRASVGAALVVLLFGIARLVRHAPHIVSEPTPADLDDAARIIGTQSSTQPNLAFLGDKGLLFNETRTAFVMYGVQGRTWVAMGDPVGPPETVPEMVGAFLAKCDDFGGVPVFYEATTAHLPCYLDYGMAFVKIGEEARVDLAALDWNGGRKARLRQSLKRLEKEHATFRVLDPQDVTRAMPELRAVSDEWRENKAVAEKGFSLGFFDEEYLARFPVAVVERDGRIEAFANLWTAGDRDELSVDLMRFRRSAPPSIMETLLAHLLRWAQHQGYRWFSLGMAPLSGLRASAASSPWVRLASVIYRHGEPLFNFQGLRSFKEKFDPAWLPRYVVYPGGMTLPRVLTAISALVAGGYRRIFVRIDARADSRGRSQTGRLHPERT